MTTKTLDDRIADAFETNMKAVDLASLLKEVEAADAGAKSDREKAERIALNPATRSDAVADARKAMDDATFRSNRLTTAQAQLKELHAKTVKAEAEAARVSHMNGVCKRRDDLVAECRAKFPALAWEIADLLDRMTHSNAECLQINVPRGSSLVNPRTGQTFNDPVEPVFCNIVDINRQSDCWLWASGMRGPGFDPATAAKYRKPYTPA